MTRETELIRLIREWDAKVPASDDATALLLVIQELRRQIEALERRLDAQAGHQHVENMRF